MIERSADESSTGVEHSKGFERVTRERQRGARRRFGWVITLGVLAPTLIALHASAQLAGSSPPAKNANIVRGGATTKASPKIVNGGSPAVHGLNGGAPANVNGDASTTIAVVGGVSGGGPIAAPGGSTTTDAPSSSTGQQSITTTTVNVTHDGIAVASIACIPDCRAGFVCREGECVSACNPICGESETCNAKRECVPRTEANEPYPYDKTRFALGGGFGVAASPDGVATPFGGVVGVSVPLGGHLFSREDILVTYAKTSAEDHPYVGSTVSAGMIPVDQTYLLVALRATAGYQLTSLLNARIGLLAGAHTLHTEHGFCGTGYVEQDDTSAAIGGTGGIALTGKHIELAAVGDVYSAETQALCTVVAPGAGAYFGQPAVLVPQRTLNAQVMAQLSFLF